MDWLVFFAGLLPGTLSALALYFEVRRLHLLLITSNTRVDEMLDRFMALDLSQYRALHPTGGLRPPESPGEPTWFHRDTTGLIEIPFDPTEESSSG